MDDAEARDHNKRATNAAAAIILGAVFLIAAASVSGVAAVAIGDILGGTLLSYGLCSACGGKADGCPPPACWPEDDRIDIPAEPPTLSLRVEPPSPAERWIERTAAATTANRGR